MPGWSALWQLRHDCVSGLNGTSPAYAATHAANIINIEKINFLNIPISSFSHQ
jgi:hypothetical protein